MNTIEEHDSPSVKSGIPVIASVDASSSATFNYDPTVLFKLINNRISAMENELGRINRRLAELEKSAHQNSNSTNGNC